MKPAFLLFDGASLVVLLHSFFVGLRHGLQIPDSLEGCGVVVGAGVLLVLSHWFQGKLTLRRFERIARAQCDAYMAKFLPPAAHAV